MIALPSADDLQVETLGACRIPSPLKGAGQRFVDEARRVLLCTDMRELEHCTTDGQAPPSFEPAGPRGQIFFPPHAIACGIVTCGGLCPGLNDVIRSIVLTLTYAYGVPTILGFRYGYAGLAPRSGFEPLRLTPEVVDNIQQHGGTMLGSSRGPHDVGEMVDTLQRFGISILFAIGGDGTLRGAEAISAEIARRGLAIGVVCIPKTIDNDIAWIARSFGFSTAVEEATRALSAAHAEARGAWNGIGLVKLMGRHSGFIAVHATLSNSDVNFCLVPEVPFALAGPDGFLVALERRLNERHHAVVVAAEGAGQELVDSEGEDELDASGNRKLRDIGVFLRDRIAAYLSGRGVDSTIKYIDPSYMIRGVTANSIDSEFCLMLGQHAVHAGMAGRTNVLVGYWNQHFTHLPVHLAASGRKQIDPQGSDWQAVLRATGQPAHMVPAVG